MVTLLAILCAEAPAGWVCDGVGVSKSDRTVYFGAGPEAYIEYDGTNLVIEPDALGSGNLSVLGTVDIGGTGNRLYDGVNGLHVRSRDNYVRLGSGTYYLAQVATASQLYQLNLTRPGVYGESLTTQGGVKIDADTDGLWLGESQDAYIGYDGADLIMDPAAAGSGSLLIGGHVKLSADERRLYFGADADAYIEYGGTSLDIVPDAVSGAVKVQHATASNVRLDIESAGENDTALGFWEGLGSLNNGISFSFNGGANYMSVKAHNGSTSGTEFLRMYKARDDLYIIRDTGKLVFGAGQDASIQYDGTDMVLTPDETGSGIVQVDGALAFESKVTKDSDAAVVLTTKDCRNALRINGDDDGIDYTLPPAAPGLTITFVNSLYDQIITVDAGPGDIVILNDGTPLAAANAVDSSGAKGDKATFIAIDATYWMIMWAQNAWIDGGAD